MEPILGYDTEAKKRALKLRSQTQLPEKSQDVDNNNDYRHNRKTFRRIRVSIRKHELII